MAQAVPRRRRRPKYRCTGVMKSTVAMMTMVATYSGRYRADGIWYLPKHKLPAELASLCRRSIRTSHVTVGSPDIPTRVPR